MAEPATIVALGFLGAVLYIGVFMVVDPASVARLLEMLVETVACGVRNFEHSLRGDPWRDRLHEPEQVSVSVTGRGFLRLTGLALTAAALLALISLVT